MRDGVLKPPGAGLQLIQCIALKERPLIATHRTSFREEAFNLHRNLSMNPSQSCLNLIHSIAEKNGYLPRENIIIMYDADHSLRGSEIGRAPQWNIMRS